LTIASRAQAWYRRPVELGGGGRTYVGMTLIDLNFDTPNDNGAYLLSGNSATNVTVTGTGTEDPNGDGTELTVLVSVGADTVGAATITQ